MPTFVATTGRHHQRVDINGGRYKRPKSVGLHPLVGLAERSGARFSLDAGLGSVLTGLWRIGETGRDTPVSAAGKIGRRRRWIAGAQNVALPSPSGTTLHRVWTDEHALVDNPESAHRLPVQIRSAPRHRCVGVGRKRGQRLSEPRHRRQQQGKQKPADQTLISGPTSGSGRAFACGYPCHAAPPIL
jgi:hypothetical protein